MSRRVREIKKQGLSIKTKRSILTLVLFVIGIISLLSLFNIAGIIGEYLNTALIYTFGLTRYAIPFIIFIFTYLIYKEKESEVPILSYSSFIMFWFGVNGLFHLWLGPSEFLYSIETGFGGGYLGFLISFGLYKLVGYIGAFIILISLILVSIILLSDIPLSDLYKKVLCIFFKKYRDSDTSSIDEDENNLQDNQSLFDNDENKEEIEDDIDVEDVIENKNENLANDDVSFTDDEDLEITEEKNSTSSIPKVIFNKEKIILPISLLKKQTDKPTGGDIIAGKKRIQKTLENFDIEVEMGDVEVGPTVTQYTFKPAPGVKISRITALQDNLALALASHPIRLEAPIPGKSLIGLEVPNKQVATVNLRDILESKDFIERKSNLMIGLGKDVTGRPWVVDISKMPHLLVAGATGSGKSVCLNTIIVSLLYQNTPETLRFIMIDPKRVELPNYNGIPHLLAPVITDVKKTVNALKWAICEMDRRYEILSQIGKRNIASYNEEVLEKMPYIVIIIDELADLMVMASNEIETSIIRLTQMARAVGIHLVLATQRPSVDVITGLIKVNIPARIAFSVASLMDSRTILDTQGAEKLIGRGDMLFLTAEMGKPKRIQGTFISDEEIKKVVSYLKEALELPVEYNNDIVEKPSTLSFIDDGIQGDNSDIGDDLFEDAKEAVIKAGKASASLLQRRLRVGYARAARLMDLLEEAGIVGPGQGAKPRDILIQTTNPENNSQLVNNDEINDV